MATINRRPLAPRALSLQIPLVVSPLKRTVSGASKRARSPDPAGDMNSKRAKGPPSPGTLAAREDERKEKERRKTEREAQKEEFRIKYTRAFPSWVFYFDLDLLDPDSASAREYLEAKVCQLGGVCYVHKTFYESDPDYF
jgi:regulatory subunit for Cdc7p protein kinase